MKRFLSIMLVLCMTLTCITPAFAEETTEHTEEVAAEETEVTEPEETEDEEPELETEVSEDGTENLPYP